MPSDDSVFPALRAEQERLRSRLSSQPPCEPIRLLAACDVSYHRASDRLYAVVLLWDVAADRMTEYATDMRNPDVPYVPGYLSFREGPALMAAFERLPARPDLVLFDGQGIAHPQGFGLAAHLGVLLDLPTIGCAKSRLVGTYNEPGNERGDRSDLMYDGHRVGTVLRTRRGIKPVFVSPGHRMDFSTAEAWILRLSGKYRLPEPLRLAHLMTNRIRLAEERKTP